MPIPLQANPKQLTILEHIQNLENGVKTIGFNPQAFKPYKVHIDALAKYLELSQNEAVLFSIVFVHMVNDGPPDLSDITKTLKIDVMRFLPHMPLLDNLIKKGYINRCKIRRRHSENTLRNKIYMVNDELMESIIHHKALPKMKNIDNKGSLEILQEIDILIGQCNDSDISQYELVHDSITLLNENRHLPIVNSIVQQEMDSQYKILLCTILWKGLLGNDIGLDFPCGIVSKNAAERLRMMHDFSTGEDPLTKGDWITTREGRFNTELDAILSDKSINLLKMENIEVKTLKTKRISTKKPDEIVKKALFFNPDEEKQWWRIHSLLQEKNFKSIQERLNEKGMSPGFTILFHGEPGTGKTESVLQLAKESGREIMKIDASMTKSMWFGESEKFMKRIFNNYEELRQDAKITPILFFNEADAILSKRKTDMSSNVSQTENALQNILLEELENFKGIFMATSNLIQNLDTAFDRRFIYKMHFSLPELETSIKIWERAFPFLSTEQNTYLSKEFQFSGAQIDNISRKCAIDYLLSGNDASLEIIEDFCEKEVLIKVNVAQRIGF